jgi:hypothetical protein
MLPEFFRTPGTREETPLVGDRLDFDDVSAS